MSESTELRFTVEMTDDLGNPVDLENGGIHTVSFPRPAFNSGSPETPSARSGTRPINFRPTTQLDARNRTYKVTVRFEHLEIPATNTYQDNGESDESPSEQLLHFNGNLRFGSGVNGIETTFSAISNTPTPGSAGAGYVNTDLNVTDGDIPGFPDYSYGSGAPLGVRLFSDGRLRGQHWLGSRDRQRGEGRSRRISPGSG